MGSPPGPFFANVFMGKVEMTSLQDTINDLSFYGRYVDDIFCLAYCTTDIDDLVQKFNSAHPSLNLTAEYEADNEIAFLDVLLHRQEDGSIQRWVFRKKNWTGQYINFHSFVPLNIKQTLVQGLAARVRRIRSPEAIEAELQKLQNTLRENGYPDRFILRSIGERIAKPTVADAEKKETGEPVPGAPTYTHRTRLHCPQCPRTFRHRMGLFDHMRIHESGIDRSLYTPTPPSPTPNPSPCAPTNRSPADIDATDLTTPHSPASSSTSSFTATTTATPASVAHDFTTAAPDTTTGTTPATSINRCEGPDYICPHCDRTFTSRIGLVETGEPVPGAPTYTHRTRLHCPHCPRTFTHRMGLFGHMRIHESGIDRNSDTATTSNTPRPILAPPSHAPTTTATTNTIASSTADTETADLSCPHCPRTFTSRIGLVGHLRIHRTETGEPVPGAPTYTHCTRLHCPHCPRTFTHRMGLFGHMRIHNDLR
nr:unnamed protein product [Spirometra erinaceieuropaei]